MDIMFTMTMLFFGLLAIFGRGGSASRLAVTARLTTQQTLEPGRDSATVSEAELSGGGSGMSGLLGGGPPLATPRPTD